MTLHFEEYGAAGSPVILFLHGLLGSSRNWRAVAKALSPEYRIFALDLPDHGASPHGKSTSHKLMREGVSEWIERHLSSPFVLCGHSLGGKLAMGYACARPRRLRGLVVVDIAPRAYPPEHHLPTLDAMLSLDLSDLKSRKHADEMLSERIPNWAFRQFLLTNLQEVEGNWQWRANLEVLRKGMSDLSDNPLAAEDSYDGPTLFLRGGKSGYLRSEHFPMVEQAFPSARILTLPNAGHDLHVDDKNGFLDGLKGFLEELPLV